MPKNADPIKLIAFQHLVEKGRSRQQIEDLLGISRATYFRLRRRLDMMAEQARRLAYSED